MLKSLKDFQRMVGAESIGTVNTFLSSDVARGARIGSQTRGAPIDMNHPGVRHWMARRIAGNGGPYKKEEKQKLLQEVDEYLLQRSNTATIGLDNDEIDELTIAEQSFKEEVAITLKQFEKYLDMTLRQIIEKHGTDKSFKEYLTAAKSIEDITDKRLRNQERSGELIRREFVRQHMIMLVDSTNSRVLNDSPRTIAERIKDEVEAGEDVEHMEETVRSILSKQLRDVKATVIRRLKAVSKGEDDDAS